ncbi:ATP-dependent helicase [Rhodomicrobium vannielii ATCC 17100]|uniref:ATP-dependent helicase n=1 Tax=Rhodomicrobium vannielii TaxID=1069 RepID=UPI0019195CAD|nr:ATP-dependent helicase [Rhodomicrobium vannielii]MBJ7532961.1 ATP-dependent helicase [Rhodomicrobium vannielii ATCC 17100]
MIGKPFEPTEEQLKVIEHEGSAFIAACPGAGKTRVMVERARKLLMGRPTGRGIAFLSFTFAAVSELEDRLRREGLVETPAFPHFIGTFDGFIWQFLIAPFGIDGCGAKPRLIPDKDDRTIKPFAGAQALPLECFDRVTGNAIPLMIQRHGFRGKIKAHETAARNTRTRFLERGELDFVEARSVALARLHDPACGAVLAPAFAARFLELIVDEAQDCNPVDLEIIAWFRAAGIPVKVICDPNQAIYGFRGGVTRELGQFAETFDVADRLPMNGNFRSSSHIVKGVLALRAPGMRAAVDKALGGYRDEPTAVHILSYPGQSVPSTIGVKFQELVAAMGLATQNCPVVSATRRTGANALGHPQDSGVRDLSYRLAVTVSDFHFSFELGGRKEALVAIHRIMLELSGRMGGKTYHQHLADVDVGPDAWRPDALALAQALRFSPERFATAESWHDEARRLLAPLLPADGPSINHRLRRNSDLDKALSVAPATGHPARTIHSVKGMEFPAICVVMSPSTAKGIIDYLAGGAVDDNEEARKIYVGASRAQRLLAIALPRTQAPRLRDLMLGMGGAVEFVPI